MGPADFKRAIEIAQERIAADPNQAMAYGLLASAYFRTDRFAEAESTLQRASERKLEIPTILVIRYNIAVLKGDQEEMDRVVSSGQGKAKSGTLGGPRGGSRSGPFRPLTGRAAVIQPRRGTGPARADRTRVRSELPGLTSGVGSRLRECCRRSKERHGGARTFQGPGRRIRRRLCPGSFGRLFPIGGARRRFRKALPGRYVCEIHLRAGPARVSRTAAGPSQQKAWSGCEIARRYELAANGLTFNGYYLGGLHSAYVRGEALIAAHRYAEAAAEFQKILDHRGIVALDPIGALAHLQLGRVFALSGDKTKAKAAYEAFLALWKDADPDIPILKSAKAEYARL